MAERRRILYSELKAATAAAQAKEEASMPREDEDDISDDAAEDVAPVAAAPKQPKQPKIRGVAAAPAAEQPRDAADLWAYLISEKGMNPFDVRLTVYQVDPPSPGGDAVPLGSGFSGGNVAGTSELPPSAMLINYVCDNYHLVRPAGRGWVRYMVQFAKAQNGQFIARGNLPLPPREEIIAVRTKEAQTRAASGEAVPAYVPPPMPQQQMPQGGFGMPQPFYPSPSFAPSGFGAGDAMSQMMGMMGEMFRASMEQRQPQIPQEMANFFRNQSGVAAAPPAPPPVSEDAIVAKVLMALQQSGVIRPPTPPPVAVVAPPPTASATTATGLQGMMENAMSRMFGAALGQVEQSIKQSIAGVGRAPAEEEDDAPATPATGVGSAPAPETPPDDGLPWRATPLADAKWGDGRPVIYAGDKNTGDPDWKGALFNNPIVAEQGLGLASKLIEAVTDAVKRVGAPTMPVGAGAPPPKQIQQASTQVVSETPSTAVDASAAPEPDWKR